MTLPGIERIGAAKLLVEIGTDMAVLSSAERLASWVGLLSRQSRKHG